MADIELNMSSDSKKILAEYDKLYRANVKLSEQNQKLASDSKKHHEDEKSFISEQVGGLKSMALGYVTVERGIEAVTEGIHKLQEKAREAWQDAAKVNLEFTKLAASGSKGQQASHLYESLESIHGIKKTDKLAMSRASRRPRLK